MRAQLIIVRKLAQGLREHIFILFSSHYRVEASGSEKFPTQNDFCDKKSEEEEIFLRGIYEM
jgi:hypothetical protein